MTPRSTTFWHKTVWHSSWLPYVAMLQRLALEPMVDWRKVPAYQPRGVRNELVANPQKPTASSSWRAATHPLLCLLADTSVKHLSLVILGIMIWRGTWRLRWVCPNPSSKTWWYSQLFMGAPSLHTTKLLLILLVYYPMNWPSLQL